MPSAWPLPERAGFLDWIASTFDYYYDKDDEFDEDEGEDDSAAGVDGTRAEDNMMMIKSPEARKLFHQQRFVRDYLQHASPYRGLLLYHSLGVGKTCAAIASAEALRPSKNGKIFVFVTKMLRGNFSNEVPTCSRPELMRAQHWIALPSADRRIPPSLVQHIPPRLLKRHGGVIWLPELEERGGIFYEELDSLAQAQIDAQIEAVIESSFTFIHYNGVTQDFISRFLQEHTTSYFNPFDGAVVIIDEVHNFVSRVANRRLLYPLYERLLDAHDCKVILLSGTPIVNSVSELAYIVNLVQGRTVIHEFQLQREASRDAVEVALEPILPRIRQLIYDPAQRVAKVVFLPRGFTRVDHDDNNNNHNNINMMMVARQGVAANARHGNHEQQQLQKQVESLLLSRGIQVRSRRTLTSLPLPDDPDTFDSHFVDNVNSAILNPGLLQRRIMGAISTYRRQSPSMFASVAPIEVVLAEMSSLQFTRYALLRHEERRREQNIARLKQRLRGSPGGRGQGPDISGQVYRSFSLALCNFVFPETVTRPFKYEMRQHRQLAIAGDEVEAEGFAEARIDQAYARELQAAVQRLKHEVPRALRMSEDLREHSPKFFTLLTKLNDQPPQSGTNLIYTRFRQVEGVELLTAAMDANGWQELRLVRDENFNNNNDNNDNKNNNNNNNNNSNNWVAKIVTSGENASGNDDDKKPPKNRYMVLRTEEDPYCNRLVLNIFNNELADLPRVTRESLDILFSGNPSSSSLLTNLRGEMARVLIITASGAEGISLKNVRHVHIMESFWNHNRLDQVIGRAVRARSHVDLPPEERTVDVFLYLATLSDTQRRAKEIMQQDQGLTSDQYLHSVAMKKKALNDQVLELMRSASVDCRVHARDDTEKSKCFALPRNLQPDEVYRSFLFDEDLTDDQYGKRVSKLVAVMVDGQKFYMDEASGNLYDYARLKESNELVLVGKM